PFCSLKPAHPIQFTEKFFTNPIDIGTLIPAWPSPDVLYPSSRYLSNDSYPIFSYSYNNSFNIALGKTMDIILYIINKKSIRGKQY
ncbi:MAG: hypothetical protein SVY10_20590, partial [Thermodesulfobacteriota bacterium]|nr:hypothetical protein [Thermodesulfobacteriota bacterium]